MNFHNFLRKTREKIKFVRSQQCENLRSQLFETGFHGDEFFLALVDKIMPGIDVFIETGTNVGTTALYIAKIYSHVSVYSCEPDDEAFSQAQSNLAGFSNLCLSQMSSPDFLYQLYEKQPELKSSRTFFWLDAHGYGYRWPLHDELMFITRESENGIIFIDDGKVPRHPQFKYSVYEGQICDTNYVENALTSGRSYRILHPTYGEHTSPHHPLVGYIGIAFGDQSFPNDLEKFTVRNLTK